MIDLSPCRAVILVFASPTCGACEDYKPRLEAEVERWQKHGVPVSFAEEDQPLATGSIAIVMIDVTSEDPGVQAYADAFRVTGLPTTVLMTRGGHQARHEGAIDDQSIDKLLREAAR